MILCVLSAPAPLPKRAANDIELHPPHWCGWWQLKYAGTIYEADLDHDGTMRVKVQGRGNDFRWRGTWGLKGGRLLWREWDWLTYGTGHKPPFDWSLGFDGKYWSNNVASMKYLFFTRPTD